MAMATMAMATAILLRRSIHSSLRSASAMRSLPRLAAAAAAAAVVPGCHALSAARIRTASTARPSPGPASPLALLDVPPLAPPLAPLAVPLPSTTVEETLERTTTSDSDNLSPFLREMVDEQRELRTNVGRAMDVLRGDYPYFLRRAPDYSIYHDSVSLSASDGQIQLSGLPSYKRAFGVVRNVLSLLYDPERSIIQSRMVYDPARTQIRVSFNAMLVPKIGALGRTAHVDGISVYSVDLSPTVRENERGELVRNEGAGRIVEHRIERLLVNGVGVRPPYFGAFGLEALAGQQGTGALAGAGAWS